MNEKKQNQLLNIIDITVYFLLLVWLVLPLFMPGFFKIELLKITFNIDSFKNAIGSFNSGLFYLSFLMYFIPLVFVFKIVTLVLKDKIPEILLPNHYISFAVNFILSSLLIFNIVFIVMYWAPNLAYFTTIDIPTDVMILVLIGFSILQPIVAINKLRYLSKSYRRYIELIRESPAKKKKDSGAMLGRIGILQKLLIAFIASIAAIILSLSALLIGDFKTTIVGSVIATGTMLADQSVSYIKDNLSENKVFFIDSYLKKEAKKNEGSSLAFESLTWYNKDTNSGNFYAKLSTDDKLVGTEIEEGYTTNDEPSYRYDEKAKAYDIISPITIGPKKIGYSVVQYQQKEIFKSYYKTQVRILLFAILIIYLAVLLVYIIGSNIVLPILYLQVNVKKIGGVLSGMIKGTEKIQASGLQYEDMIKSNDEIKTLSGEINNMITVIKGIIPYISASTLKHSDRTEKTSMIKDLTFLFTDIRGFTTLCEGKSPDEVVSILNQYLDLQTQIILDNDGDIDKFVGDELMAVFDGPDKEINACKAAMEITQAMEAERERRIAKKEPTVEIGIGINSGTAVFGSMGARERMDFTCIGDNVNIAARLEGANKAYQSKSLVTESVYKKVHGKYLCREIDFMTVKGKKEPIRIFEVLHEKSVAPKKEQEIKERFERGLKLYREVKWDEAMTVFKENFDQYKDGPSNIFYQRCAIFKKTPPAADWDGVFNLTVK